MSTALRIGRMCLLWLTIFILSRSESTAGSPPQLTREDLIGTWRLVALSYSGPNATHADPFYQPGSTGILIYDRSGWMSVQISAPRRQAVDIPADRRVPGEAGERDRKASAFDTYYAYYGTWSFDPANLSVTHHVTGALIAAETGRDYTQLVGLERGRLVLTTRTGPPGQEAVREKIWQRANEPH